LCEEVEVIWDYWSLSDLRQVDCRSLATLNAKLDF
jgi:hypothetical protein